MRSPLLLLVLGSFLGGCGTFVDFTPINEPPHPLQPRSSASVEVFSSGPPARPHVDVALVEVEQTRSLNEQGTGLMIQRMREQAAAIGCDAIVLRGVTDHQGSGDLFDPGATKREAACIVYDDDPSVGSFTRAAPTVAPPPRKSGFPQNADLEDPR